VRLTSLFTRFRPALATLAVLLLSVWLVSSVMQARRTANGAGPNARLETYREAALWVAANSPRGSVVFNTDWDDFPQLFYWNTHNVYILGLDATYMSLYDLELYQLWRGISGGSVRNPSVPIRERFGAGYVFSDTRHTRFLTVAAQDPGLELAYRTQGAVVFRVREAPG
jgi:hypothetical protein